MRIYSDENLKAKDREVIVIGSTKEWREIFKAIEECAKKHKRRKIIQEIKKKMDTELPIY